ncbi:Stk1 family PASTA domain-containing Ser/Thr kinase [Nocardioides sp. TRM66260-LWL]|uniref:Stk1 family PASTA domain-containing Ser/Thr kinase n=1 Tax=Nocardioides sp. TRM66260-LWL TaxID=2874478 RepID=UPI001CC639FC|nr:Stk1 family PASTA domain-containing Ser/Thr kinase [Nocardioides sp. TRM66260-LWL]MBZ5733328.1 Stk1 family PASTA domain-containing Ser/Thr kinase [Nocardioides sp. TRM66260-LWL]
MEQSPRSGSVGASSDPLTGRLLDGRYRVGRRIARGGMAGVYEAVDVRLDRLVAVKIMHAGLGDDAQFAARFVREARAAARLTHPHVVSVYDQGADDGTVFLAMELVPGHTLRDVISQRAPMPPAQALALLEPVVSALAAAHRAGLMHRDVKPENVLISEDGQVKVADFGLAKAISAETQHTATGVLIGTVSYVAPELVVDGSGDARADVYAVGVILHELLTGQKPHQGESPIQVAYKHVHEDVPPPSRLVPGLPAYVDALVARATARDVTQRPSDAGVLLRHLHRVQQALREGVDDPGLTQDLTPLVAALGGTEEIVGVEEIRDRLHEPQTMPLATRPPARAEGLSASDVEHTTVAPLAPPYAPVPTPAGPAASAGGAAPRRRRRRGPLLLVLAVVLALAVAGGAYWFGYARYASLPSVLDLTQAQATARLEAAGYRVQTGAAVYSDDVARGHVVSTDPDPGSRVLDGATVTLVISRGVEQYPVPDLAGRTRDDAEQALRDTRLEVGLVTGRYSETVPQGQVISSDPKAGTELRRGVSVDLVVSKGRQPIRVGSWVGKPADDAQRALEARGLRVDRGQQQFSDTVPAGSVISQSPRGGTLFRGDTVTLVVSRGPELVKVPGGLIGSGVDAARSALEAQGFKVKVARSGAYIGLQYVLRTSPGSGDQVPKGSTITLFLV